VPRVLPAELVPAANTLSFTASNLGMVLGPLLAGLILARWSFAAAYAADFAVFTIALYAAMRLPALPPAGAAITPGLRSVVDGLAFILTSSPPFTAGIPAASRVVLMRRLGGFLLHRQLPGSLLV
jgi:hypothetical protein